MTMSGVARIDQRISQRMADTGMDGYACAAEMEWDMAHPWARLGYIANEAAVTFRQIGEAIDQMVQQLAQITYTPPVFLSGPGQILVRPLDDDDWSMDAYSETGDARGGDPRHPYIEVMRDIDAVLAEPETGYTRGCVVVDESQDWQGITVTRDGEVVSRLGGRLVVGFDGSLRMRSGSSADWWEPSVEGEEVRLNGLTYREWEEGEGRHQTPIPAPESPAERALRLRRCRGTGPALPRAQEAHRPRRHS
jgi:hypothetical protein